MDDVTASYELEDVAAPVLRVRGEVDLDTREQFVEALRLLRAHDGSARVDLSDVTFIDSSGISALIESQKQAIDDGSQLVLIAPSSPCRRVIEILGLDDFFRVEAVRTPSSGNVGPHG